MNNHFQEPGPGEDPGTLPGTLPGEASKKKVNSKKPKHYKRMKDNRIEKKAEAAGTGAAEEAPLFSDIEKEALLKSIAHFESSMNLVSNQQEKLFLSQLYTKILEL